jgi:hypothetical protein
MSDERKRYELDNRGDYISGEVGEDGKDIVVGKNIDTRRSDKSQRNDVNINVGGYDQRYYQPPPQESAEEYQRRMLRELEKATQDKFTELNNKFTELNISLNNLISVVSANSRISEANTDAVRQQLAETRKIAERTETTVMASLKGLRIVPAEVESQPDRLPKWVGYLGLMILFMIMIFLAVGVYGLTMGGA